MKRHVGILIAILVFLVQFALLPGTGMTWDEPASFFIGRMNLQFWQTGDWTNLIDYSNTTRFADSPFKYVVGEEFYPPFPFVVSSAVSYMFAERLNLFNFIDAHHMGELLIAAVGVWAFYGLAFELGLSMPIAVATTLLYVLYPTIFGQMRNDAKDIPLMSMLVITIYLFVRWVSFWQAKRYNKTWIYGFGIAIVFGWAIATKPSAVIIGPILATWFLWNMIVNKRFSEKTRRLPLFITTVVILSIVSVGVFFASWPWLWDNPAKKLNFIVWYFSHVGYHMPVLYFGQKYNAGINLPLEYPFGILLVQTPIELTLLAIIGLGAVVERFIKKKDGYALLPLWWFGVGMSRFFIPGMLIYARVRHFIDVMPAFFLLVGFGLQALWQIIRLKGYAFMHTKALGNFCILVGVLAIIVHEALIIKTYYPYEPSYFNFIVGGTKNVAEKRLFDAEYWASGVKEAMDYINFQSLINPVSVYSCGLRHMAMYYAVPTVRLVWTNPEMAQYSIIPNSASWFADMLEYSKSQHLLAYTVKRGGADLFYVYQNTNGRGWRCGWETAAVDASKK